MKLGYQPPLQVSKYTGTKKGDPDRGPMIRMRPEDARLRLLEDGELAWVYGPRRHELAVLVYDEAVPPDCVFARDIAGISVSEMVRIVKPSMDNRRDRNLA